MADMLRGTLSLLALLICSSEISTGHIQSVTDEEPSTGAWFSNSLETSQVEDMAQLSWQFIQDLQCWLWQESCDGEKPVHPDWSWSSVGWHYLRDLAGWYSSDVTHGRIINNLTGLGWDLDKRVHGQHLAIKVIKASLERFIQREEPQKPLLLSFHGWTGTGKNLAARIIAESLYEGGQRSPCVRVFIPQLHFPHQSHIEAYMVKLTQHIRDVSSRCLQPLFVFDEADKFPDPLLTSLSPLLSTAEAQHRRSIFLFISTLGGSVINEVALSFWNAGRQREEVTADDMDRPLRIAIKETQGNLPQLLLAEGVIHAFVPFLPLERAHVKLCAEDFFVARGLPYTESTLEEVTNHLVFVPNEEKIFSVTGCKMIAQRIHFMETGHR